MCYMDRVQVALHVSIMCVLCGLGGITCVDNECVCVCVCYVDRMASHMFTLCMYGLCGLIGWNRMC